MADPCTTADCPNDAVTLTTCDGAPGYYPYCEECSTILLRGGEEEHPQMARKRAEKRSHFEQVCAERDLLRAALADLVRLKDGPRDDAYERGKPLAWQRAREALEDSASTRKRCR